MDLAAVMNIINYLGKKYARLKIIHTSYDVKWSGKLSVFGTDKQVARRNWKSRRLLHLTYSWHSRYRSIN